MPAVATIARKVFIASITGKYDGNLLFRQFADTVSWQCRTVRIRLIIQIRKMIDQIKIIWIDLFNAVS